MITKTDKADLLRALKKVDVKDMSVEHESEAVVKWFRFGNFNALQIVAEIIKQWPEKTDENIVS